MVRLRWIVLLAGLALVVVGATWGAGVFGELEGGGFDDPSSESSKASQRITAELGSQEADVIALYSSEEATVDDSAFRDGVLAALERARSRPEVANVTSWYDAPPDVANAMGLGALVATDRRATYAVVRLRPGNDDAKLSDFAAIRSTLGAGDPITTELGGRVAFLDETNEQTTQDIVRAETLSLPVLLVLLVLIFGGLVAASTPLIIGGVAILGAFVTTRLLASVTDVSIFAINIITLIGMGMAIDYSLFIVSRFREELAAGRDVAPAIERTIMTAGRTVLVSGLTVSLALASLLIFPQFFLRSLAMGGIAAVLIAVLAAVSVLPALLAVLGPHVNALRVRGRRRGTRVRREDGSGWARLADSVMRRPVTYIVVVVTGLFAMAVPFAHIDFGGFDERVLPPDTPVRSVAQQIGERFPSGSLSAISVVVSRVPATAAAEHAARIGTLPDVTSSRVTASQGETSLISVTYHGEPTSERAEKLVRTIRDLPPPPGAKILVGGRTAANVDLLEDLSDRLPFMILIIILTVLVLLFVAFRSVVLPIKAVVMNMVSIGASFGVVVWIFQDGHFSDLFDFTSTGFVEPTMPILMLAVIFGLSTDYEVFLLSRVREEWDLRHDNSAAVAAGLQHTGGIISAAALLLVVVVAGFSVSGIVVMKMIGIGMIVAIVVDATLVRLLLVPATMRLLGSVNWWLPGASRREAPLVAPFSPVPMAYPMPPTSYFRSGMDSNPRAGTNLPSEYWERSRDWR
jgi:RND superfamily putative drug exporter